MSATILALAALLGGAPSAVPEPPEPYAWVCGHLDAAPTVFGVWGIPTEAEKRGLVPDPEAIAGTVEADCPEHLPLIDSGLGLVVGG